LIEQKQKSQQQWHLQSVDGGTLVSVSVVGSGCSVNNQPSSFPALFNAQKKVIYCEFNRCRENGL